MPAEKQSFAVRLPKDLSTAVEQYCDDYDTSQADTLRACVREYMTARGYPKDQTVMADGSGRVFRPVFREIGAIFAVLGLAAVAVAFLIATDTAPPVVHPLDALAVALAGFTYAAVFMLILATRAPEWLDYQISRRTRNAAGWLRRRVGA